VSRDETVHVVGIGADGWDGLAPPARAALAGADVILGSDRQLALLPGEVAAERRAWLMPLLPTLVSTLAGVAGRRRAVLASGDPTFFGIATTIARLCPDTPLDVVPHPSSLSLACARLGWPQQDTDVLSVVGRPVAALARLLHPGRRVLVLAAGADDPAAVCALLREHGFGTSTVSALSNLGGAEQVVTATAADWPERGWPGDARSEALTVLGVACAGGPGLALTPGLPDDVYEHDGQLTKRHVRAVTLAALAPTPGELLWDVGGGAGSIGIEWLRTHPSCRALSVERDATRAKRIEHNAARLGTPGLRVVLGEAPAVLAGLATPDAVFVGGGLTAPGLVDACWAALRPGGRLVANVTTLESEASLLGYRDRLGGDLVRIEISRTTPVGRFTGWRPAMPVTQWTVVKP
jgi:precorrin-6Y C5,15-methyltransferase (decarboxylating)